MDFFIKRATDDFMMCIYSDCFEDATWFVEGNFYCNKHKKLIIKILEEARHESQMRKGRDSMGS